MQHIESFPLNAEEVEDGRLCPRLPSPLPLGDGSPQVNEPSSLDEHVSDEAQTFGLRSFPKV